MYVECKGMQIELFMFYQSNPKARGSHGKTTGLQQGKHIKIHHQPSVNLE